MNKIIWDFKKIARRLPDDLVILLRDLAQAEIDRRRKAEEKNIQARGGGGVKFEGENPEEWQQGG
jgi:hypothetical protein